MPYLPEGTPVLLEGTPALPAHTSPAPEAYLRVELGAVGGQSAPDLWLPQARKALLGDTRHWHRPRDTPAELKPFVRASGRLRTRIGHQLGGHALPVRGPVEYEIANATLGGGTHTWRDEGTLYWLIRTEDPAAHRLDQVRLTVRSWLTPAARDGSPFLRLRRCAAGRPAGILVAVVGAGGSAGDAVVADRIRSATTTTA
ncbi:DUF1963 domain-containing protein [Streptomyces phaeolivaceus]|uniref:DUF1963 domain-containing protein n=1 Tax=Streptomyces phaeolivaceus TaxID=2653200 RepID=A0A5P8JWW6_9ACTN|nr:hypothetical protein [Streptomyces phaeolivaceus]QFQ94917.1 DUF1963 domain-containing protein [Streptomyces phaeolivaceus]